MRRFIPFCLIAALVWPLSASALFGSASMQGNAGAGGGGVTTAYLSVWQVSHSYEASTGGTDYVAVPGSSNVYVEATAGSCTSASGGAGPTGTGTGISDGTCTWNFIHAYSAGLPVFVVPANYTSTVSAASIGAGGGGSNGSNIGYGGNLASGGGGAYAAVTVLSTSGGSTITFSPGVGGPGGTADGSNLNAGVSGTATWFNGTTCVGATVCADFGVGGNTTGGQGGLTANSVGSTKFAGGNSGAMTEAAPGGGGGAGGPDGAGQVGGAGFNNGSGGGNDSGGGGGSDGGTAGSAGLAAAGGAGGNNFAGSGGGIGGTSSGANPTNGSAGGGGGGDDPSSSTNIAGAGLCGTLFDSIHGPSGGGAGASAFAVHTPTPGTSCWGGGAGSAAPGTPTAGAIGGFGLIAFKYNHS